MHRCWRNPHALTCQSLWIMLDGLHFLEYELEYGPVLTSRIPFFVLCALSAWLHVFLFCILGVDFSGMWFGMHVFLSVFHSAFGVLNFVQMKILFRLSQFNLVCLYTFLSFRTLVLFCPLTLCFLQKLVAFSQKKCAVWCSEASDFLSIPLFRCSWQDLLFLFPNWAEKKWGQESSHRYFRLISGKNVIRKVSEEKQTKWN